METEMPDTTNITYMAIDRDTDAHYRESELWRAQGVGACRVDSMTEGIIKAISNQFLYIAINADTVDYAPTLHILRDVTHDPILIGTHNFSVQAQTQALRNGADFYGKFGRERENMDAALATIRRVSERAMQGEHMPLLPLIGGDIILSQLYRCVFVRGIEVTLHKKEFDILQYLMANNGRVIPHIQLLQKVWGEDFGEYDTEVLWRTINRLRGKLSRISTNGWDIKVERGVGYKFSS